MIALTDYISTFPALLSLYRHMPPWEITRDLQVILQKIIPELGSEYLITDQVAIHQTAILEKGITLKGPVIIEKNVFVGANSYLRGGVFLDEAVTIGPGCEIKSSILCSATAIAHFNFIGDSIIGQGVNFEAGSITANHHNDKENKQIYLVQESKIIDTQSEKFGSLVGDGCKIGANAVLSPGTVLTPKTIVNRLELIDQLKNLSK